jgi:hypothetical protein
MQQQVEQLMLHLHWKHERKAEDKTQQAGWHQGVPGD